LIFGLEPMHFVALPRLIAAVLVAALLTVLADPWAASSAVRNDALMMPLPSPEWPPRSRR
jgi:ABC-type transporter Mla maintaining outer membrane lipid asymmetry permease subunit MlaE